MTDAPIVVIGAGVAGLACALRLQRLARTASDGSRRTRAIVLERSSFPGGKVVTERAHGFVIDGAADVFVGSKPRGREFCAEIGIADELVETEARARRTFEWREGMFHAAAHYSNETLLTPALGMRRIVEAAIAALVDVPIRTGVAARGISRARTGFVVRTDRGDIDASAVVVALPSSAAAPLLGAVAPDASHALAEVAMRSLFTVSAGFTTSECRRLPDSYGFIVPDAPAGAMSACTWSSTKIAGRAPAGHLLARGFVHGDGCVTTAAARDVVIPQMREALGARGEPVLVRSFHWRRALPRSATEASERGSLARRTLEGSGIMLAGQATGAPGLPDAIVSGESAAEDAWRSATTSLDR